MPLKKDLDPVVEKGTDVLPPAGDERREVLAMRQDALEQKAEEQATATGMYAMDPKALAVENEIAQYFNELQVTNAQVGYRYCWVNFVNGRGRQVQYKLSRRIKGKPVWEVVRGDSPECPELRAADGTRVLGDVLLMRCREEMGELLDQEQKIMAARQQEGITANFLEVADKYGIKIRTGEDMSPETMKRLSSRAQAQQTASRMTNSWLRQGRMPGMKMR